MLDREFELRDLAPVAENGHGKNVSQGRASVPAPANPAEMSGGLTICASKPGDRTSDRTNAPSGAKPGHARNAVQRCSARLQQSAPADEISEAVQPPPETQGGHDCFADSLIADIAETWRQRQDMVRAQQKLTLQAKAICRRFTAGDKGEAEKVYQAVLKQKEHPLAELAGKAILPLLLAQGPLKAQRATYEKRMAKLGKDLPIAHMVAEIKGVSTMTLATIVAEVGDMSAYEKGVAGIWKRAGLAVIDGERQRKKAGEAALLHGYSPERHAVFWNVGCALLKAQGKIAEDGTDNRGPYRVVYDERKAYERPRVESDGHAHNRAMRYMTKRLLKHLWMAWRDAA